MIVVDVRAARAASRSARVVAALLSLAACAPTLNWREVRFEECGLVALFPCRPAEHSRPVTVAGYQTDMSLRACEASGMTFAVGHADVHDPAVVSTGLGQWAAASAANIRFPGRPAKKSWDVPGSTPAAASGRVELQGTLPSGAAAHVSLVLFARGTRIFQATVVASAEGAEAADAFFSSLNLSS